MALECKVNITKFQTLLEDYLNEVQLATTENQQNCSSLSNSRENSAKLAQESELFGRCGEVSFSGFLQKQMLN
jgi:hypothetical protein